MSLRLALIYKEATPGNEGLNRLACLAAVGAARAFYPKEMLSNNLYVLFYGKIIDAKAGQFKEYGSLESFLDDENAIQDGATVVCYGRKDYEAFSSAVDIRRFWSPSTHIQTEPNRAYRVYTYESPSRHIPSNLNNK